MLPVKMSYRDIIAVRCKLDSDEPWVVVYIPSELDTGFRLNMTLSDQEVKHWKRLNG